jgi:hypothetical protein
MTIDAAAEATPKPITQPLGDKEAQRAETEAAQAVKFAEVEKITGINAPQSPSITNIEPDLTGSLLQRARARGEITAPPSSTEILATSDELERMKAAEKQRLETEAALRELNKTPTPGKKPWEFWKK